MRMPTVSRRQALAYGVVVLALLVLVGRSVVASDGDGGDDQQAETEPALVLTEPRESETTLLVHVAGAVREPGVYELPGGSRVAEAVERAGGPRARAALESINLAAELIDGQQVVVPLRQSVSPSPTAEAGPSAQAGQPAPASSEPRISLSSASATQLEELPGVGPVTAARIIAHREENGPFRAVEELAAVSGIGQARIEAIRDMVRP